MLRNLALILIIISIAACGSGTGGISQDTGKGFSKASNSSDIHILSTEELRNKVLASLETASPGSYVKGQVVVKFRPGVLRAQSTELHKRFGASTIREIKGVSNAELVSLPEGMSVVEAVKQYMADPSVEYAEPNYILKIAATVPNDEYFSQQWALQNNGNFASGTPDADIDAPEAWDFWQGDRWLTVAVIDTGIDYNHNDLILNIWNNPGEANCVDGIDNDGNGYVDDCRGWDFTTCALFDPDGTCVTPKARDNDPMDDHGHGTHVAGIIGAAGNNFIGMAGVNWRVSIMPLKALNSQGSGAIADIVSAIGYAIANGARVINASFGSYNFSATLYTAVSNANAAGVLFVAAAGNESVNNDLTPSYPASFDLPNIISVAASDQNDRLASFSNFGANSVDVAAPGVYILSTIPNNGFMNKDFWPGTSMAAPHVSGLAALLMTYPDYVTSGYTMYQFRALIEAFVDRKPQFNGYLRTAGRINAYHALSSMVRPNAPVAETNSPNEVNLSWTPRQSETARERINLIIERSVGNNTSYQVLAEIPGTSTGYKDTSVTGGVTYYYRIRAHKYLDSTNFPYVPEGQRDIYSLYSSETVITTPVTTSGGGGGCSILVRPAATNTTADIFVMLLPVIALYLLRRFRR